MGTNASIPPPQLLEAYSQFFRVLSEPARLQLVCLLRQGEQDVPSPIATTGFSHSHISRQLGQLQRAGLIRSTRKGQRTLWRTEGDLVDQLCTLVQTRLRSRLEEQRQTLQGA
jgi:DNA-binding transcriptional ArsR family regulator